MKNLSALDLGSMKKRFLTPEIILLISSFIVTGFAIIFMFKPPAMNYVKLIKWSQSSTLEEIFENTALRMYPILAESRYLTLKPSQDLQYNPQTILDIIKKVTLIPAGIEDNDPHFISLEKDKTRAVILDIQYQQKNLSDIISDNHFDALNLSKLLKKMSENKTDGYVFALYQSAKHTYTLFIFNLSNS